MTVEKELEKIAKYLNIKIDCSFTDDGVIQMKAGKNNLIGFASILNKIHNDRYKNNKEQSIEEHYLTKQFFDFANLFIRSTTKRDKYAACSELNSYLEKRSYLIGEKISLADLVVYYSLNEIMTQLSPMEKENYINLSRYYDHFQNMSEIRQDSKMVNFSTIHLYSWNTKA